MLPAAYGPTSLWLDPGMAAAELLFEMPLMPSALTRSPYGPGGDALDAGLLAMESARSGDFATAERHHLSGHDRNFLYRRILPNGTPRTRNSNGQSHVLQFLLLAP